MNRVSSVHFQPLSQDTVKNKLITSMSMLLIVVSLYVTYYILFLRTMEVGVTKDAGIEYRGEDGPASVRITNRSQNYNQRIQELVDSITYEAKPARRLKNGDKLTIIARYNGTLANRHHVNPIRTARRVKVKDLPERFVGVNEIPASFLSTLDDRTRGYLNESMRQILNKDFTPFFICSQSGLINQKQMYRVFLDGKKPSTEDEIIGIYAVTTKGEINTPSKKETLEMKEDTIYYMITYSEINISLRTLDENVYGEKLIISESNGLMKET